MGLFVCYMSLYFVFYVFVSFMSLFHLRHMSLSRCVIMCLETNTTPHPPKNIKRTFFGFLFIVIFLWVRGGCGVVGVLCLGFVCV